jgi:hypothetical protein
MTWCKRFRVASVNQARVYIAIQVSPMRITVLLYPNRKSTNPLLDEGSASNPAMCSYTQLGAAISRVQSDANHRCRSHVEGGDRVGVGYEADSTVQRLVYAKENGSAIALNFHGVRDWILPAVVLIVSCRESDINAYDRAYHKRRHRASRHMDSNRGKRILREK